MFFNEYFSYFFEQNILIFNKWNSKTKKKNDTFSTLWFFFIVTFSCGTKEDE